MIAEKTRTTALKRRRDGELEIKLTAVEKKIFDCLLDIVTKAGQKTVLRVAGGWVRDKLLGLYDADSVGDIDLALDDTSGREFAELVQSYLEESETCSTTAVIEKNADKSKHLETARLKIFDVWIDIVNLRTESYSADSRVPEIAIGTPEEDALRRDLTINSLFYNLKDMAVEDFTGHGLTDLEQGIIRTPLAPIETFLDDPLRSLRAIRFAGKLGFDVDESILDACRKSEVQKALETKVSKERVGIELDKMLLSSAPLVSLGMLRDTKLFLPVFLPTDMPRMDPLPFERSSLPELSFLAAEKFLASVQRSPEKLTKQEIRLGLLAAIFFPLAKKQVYTKESKPKKPVTVASHVIRHCLKLRTKDAEQVDLLHNSCTKLLDPSFSLADRLGTALLLREVKTLYMLVTVLAESQSSGGFTSRAFQEAVSTQGLGRVWELKPMLNGKQVMDILPQLRGGPQLGQIINAQVEWQIMNPDGTTEDCKNWLRDQYANLT